MSLSLAQIMGNERKAATSLENRFMTKQRRATYIALEELNFVWDQDEVQEFTRLWKDGMDFRMIAKRFNRDSDECALLLMDLARRGRVKPREMGLCVNSTEKTDRKNEEEMYC